MKKLLIGIVAIFVLGVGYWLISPFFLDKRVSEESPFQTSGTEPNGLSRGQFEGFDRIHYGSGNVELMKVGEEYVIRFEENFNVANGPDLVVGLGKDGIYKPEAQIAKLKGNIGSQNYVVPTEINIEDYNEVWIWCRAFSVGFAKARLNPLAD